jgi:hypothetical protein
MEASWRRLRRALVVLLLLGCAADPNGTPPDSGRTFAPSGFLGDYAELRSGRGTQARLGYLDTAAGFSGYTHVIVEPVVVWKSDEARFAGVSQERREMLARELEAEMRRAFAHEFVLADGKPGPSTIRLRSGLTAAIAASESSVPSLLQYVEVELELLDAATNERLAAAVDSKGWTDSSARADRPYVAAGEAFRDWAERASIRLAALRSLDREPPDAP